MAKKKLRPKPLSLTEKALRAVTDVRALPLVEVAWVDSGSDSTWQNMDRALAHRSGLIECLTVGRLLKATTHEVRIVASVSEFGQVDLLMAIPRSCVHKVYRLHREKA